MLDTYSKVNSMLKCVIICLFPQMPTQGGWYNVLAVAWSQ